MIRRFCLAVEKWVEDDSAILALLKFFLVVGPLIFAPMYLVIEQPWRRWGAPPIPHAELDLRYWTCTASHVAHHESRPGMLTRFGRMSDHPAYNSDECDQWSAQWTTPRSYDAVTVQP